MQCKSFQIVFFSTWMTFSCRKNNSKFKKSSLSHIQDLSSITTSCHVKLNVCYITWMMYDVLYIRFWINLFHQQSFFFFSLLYPEAQASAKPKPTEPCSHHSLQRHSNFFFWFNFIEMGNERQKENEGKRRKIEP